jgi:hypothetical protein
MAHRARLPHVFGGKIEMKSANQSRGNQRVRFGEGQSHACLAAGTDEALPWKNIKTETRRVNGTLKSRVSPSFAALGRYRRSGSYVLGRISGHSHPPLNVPFPPSSLATMTWTTTTARTPHSRYRLLNLPSQSSWTYLSALPTSTPALSSGDIDKVMDERPDPSPPEPLTLPGTDWECTSGQCGTGSVSLLGVLLGRCKAT